MNIKPNSFQTSYYKQLYTMKAEGYSIRDLEVLSGIKAHTIRIWEKRYELLKPERTETNIRYYSDIDLRRILNVSLLVKNGYKISKVARWKENEIAQKVVAVTDSKTSEKDYIEQLMLHMLNFDNQRFFTLTNEIILKLGVEDASFNVFFKLFERIGTFWQVGSIFPAQEHYVTNVFRQKIIAEIDRIGLNNKRNKTILFYLNETELHEMSLLFYSFLANKTGYNVVYLGQFVPFNDLAKVQENLKIDFVFTSFINSFPKDKLELYLNNLKEKFQHQKIFVTGRQIFEHNPKLPRNVKAVKDYNEFKKYLG